jgi:Ca2+-binding EF-hand superfamily protein
LSSSKEEIEQLQKEFLRLDKDKTGSLKLEDLKRISLSGLGERYKNLSHDEWEEILKGCDLNNDGVIDFQDFISACIDRKALVHNSDIETAFKIIDVNGDGLLDREDFQTLFSA